MRELFIYYQVRAVWSAEALGAVRRLQRDLCLRHPGLSARLLRRPPESDGAQTWMEIYAYAEAPDARGVDTELQADIEACAQPLMPMLDGPRHVEAFIVA